MNIVDPEQELEDQGSRGQNLQILVVDDSPVYHKLVSDALCYQPYSLLHAMSGSEALDLFAKYSPPIVITDWMMPNLTGPELCKRIRESSKTSYTYLILLTSNEESDSLVNGLEAGADEFLTKPFDPAELQARLSVGRRIFQLHSQIDAKDKQIEESSRMDPVGEINEKLGREAGDTVLRDFAEIMRDTSRPADICGRVGDDELVCVMT